ncbi:MAG: sigma-54-dependent Fis family transcriptional regulator [Acidobacteria bacterium]|nr:sigma-54-dependent Fis family transcriptional regulator [Acidobacteriota bacterium]MBI3656101.1 sigma-54-dependent Fis family transcriptional regulator [Acidobacteriota bacterium]
MSDILVIDDDPSVRAHLQRYLVKKGYQVIAVDNGLEGIERLKAGLTPAVVILDLMMPVIDGFETLDRLREFDRELPVIVLSGINSTRSVVDAIRRGAYDYLTKPFQGEELEIVLQKVFDKKNLFDEVKKLRGQVAKNASDKDDYFISANEKMTRIKEVIAQIADTDVTVLIQGESGVGKEVVARSIHVNSNRLGKLFVKVNCAAIPGELLESELFGFEKGAFTGAVRQKPGKFEFADGGTIFLDEISELSFPLQGKLLHVLQEGEFSRLGGKDEIKVDVRVLAATNRDLETLSEIGDFREDLFYRLNVIRIDVPPLRARPDEIPLLCQYFFEKFNDKYGNRVAAIPDDLMTLFLRYDWPGNIRELENVIKRFLILADQPMIESELTGRIERGSARAASPVAVHENVMAGAVAGPLSSPGSDAVGLGLKKQSKQARGEAERQIIQQVLRSTNFSKRKTAETLKISYRALLYKMKQYDI